MVETYGNEERDPLNVAHLWIPGDQMGDRDGLGMTIWPRLRVGGDMGWGGALGDEGKASLTSHPLFLAQTYLRRSKRCMLCLFFLRCLC